MERMRRESTAALSVGRPHTEACPEEKHHVSSFSGGTEEDWTPSCSWLITAMLDLKMWPVMSALGGKLKALKSCLVCLASYCEKHLQPHHELPVFVKHKLVEPSKKLQENICSRHDEVMKIFCRTDQQCICYLCSMEEHKGHDTVSAAAERTERQRELEVSRQNIQQRIQDREKDVKELQQEVEAINGSADKAVEDSEKIFTELIRLMEKEGLMVKQQVRSQQETEVSRVKELQEKLEQEITELKRKDAELKKFSHTEDHNQFLHNYPSLSRLSQSTDSSSINIRPLRDFEDVTACCVRAQR
ncbi:Tripartite motif-containing protein 29 [Nibea albiflora]|uniref:Tripartite motif-containing protein 29 n=1 Tax=Nibea albiflora TaxID=240163 RepID=A0ACB7ER84_NIBAL|nr:Tripartite motif-containing protein 29 [Nibea albiflora]